MVVVPVLAALIAAGFSAALLRQFSQRGRPHQAVWGVALAMFAIAAAAEAVGAAAGWSPLLYRVYYLFGALLNVGWLAVGSVFVLHLARTARIATVVMAVLTLVSIVAVITAHVDPARLHAAVPDRASSIPAVLPAVINSLATVVLVGGAAWSAWQTHRRVSPPGMVVGLALIAAGALIVGAAHSIAAAAGGVAILRPVSEAAGIAVMCAGYLAVEAQRGRLFSPRTI